MMKKVIGICLVALVFIVFALPATAQDDVRLQSLRVGLWPEYDQPSLLVIYWGELTSDITYPATVSLRIPASVAAPHVVAAQPDAESSVAEAVYEDTIDGDWRVITFEAGGPLFQFEYYVPFSQDGQARTMGYTWPGDYAVELLSIELQQPPHSDGMTTTPTLTESGVNSSDNLIYYGEQVGALAAGETWTLLVEYTRESDELTVELLSAMQAQSEAVNTVPTLSSTSSQSAGGTDIIVLVVVAVVFFLLGAAAMRVAINIQTLSK